MTNKHKWVVIAYIFGQLIIPILITIGSSVISILYDEGLIDFDISQDLTMALAIAIGSLVTLLATVYLMKKDIQEDIGTRGWIKGKEIVIAVIGTFTLFIAQAISVYIETAFGITSNSENTQMITEMIKNYPALFLFPAIYAPILEEIIFRKFLMGGLKRRFGFWPAILVSSILFGAVHMELQHLLIYSSMGFVLGYLYHRTERIAVPILAHGIMNALVVVFQFVSM
ncbi:MAG: protease family protein [Bacillales bacterium]|jgi:membrane protease YdiL (CAAX protease family)|nr:protease family protein [Bacillales bacterium]